jgi:hypothetical protein
MTDTCLVACHQPDLLPYTGFWHKMQRADVFVLLPYDQFQKHGYQRRVLMREYWYSHRLVNDPSLIPINEVWVHPGWQDRLIACVRGRYRGSQFWKLVGPDLCERIEQIEGSHRLSEVNTALIRMMADLLNIKTPIINASPVNLLTGTDRVIQHVLAIPGATGYLSGAGARAYMPDAEDRFAEHGLTLEWSRHHPTSPDSILTTWFDAEHPMDGVRLCDSRS